MKLSFEKYLKIIVCISIVGFTFLFLGGDFLHIQMHDHVPGHEMCYGHAHSESQLPVNESEEECLLFKLLLLALIVFHQNPRPAFSAG